MKGHPVWVRLYGVLMLFVKARRSVVAGQNSNVELPMWRMQIRHTKNEERKILIRKSGKRWLCVLKTVCYLIEG